MLQWLSLVHCIGEVDVATYQNEDVVLLENSFLDIFNTLF